MFLLAANRCRGRCRSWWLIMAFWMAAIATLIFATAGRCSLKVGLAAGGRPDTTIVLLDRSPSMQQGGASGSEAGDGPAAIGRRTLRRSAAVALVESGDEQGPRARVGRRAADRARCRAGQRFVRHPRHVLESLPITQGEQGRTDRGLIGSDLRENDWNADGGRWQACGRLPPVPAGRPVPPCRPPARAPQRGDPRDHDVRRQKAGDGAGLVIPLRPRGDGLGPRVDPGAVRRRRASRSRPMAGRRPS